MPSKFTRVQSLEGVNYLKQNLVLLLTQKNLTFDLEKKHNNISTNLTILENIIERLKNIQDVSLTNLQLLSIIFYFVVKKYEQNPKLNIPDINRDQLSKIIPEQYFKELEQYFKKNWRALLIYLLFGTNNNIYFEYDTARMKEFIINMTNYLFRTTNIFQF